MARGPCPKGTVYPRVICPDCSKEVAGHVPLGGDGSVLHPHWHYIPTSQKRTVKGRHGMRCPGEYKLVLALNTDEGEV